VTALGGFDRYVYGGTRVAGETSLVRVDLGHRSTTKATTRGRRTWCSPTSRRGPRRRRRSRSTSDGQGDRGRPAAAWSLEDATTNPSEAAWLQTARIRMGTVEDKYFTYATLRGNYGATAPIGVSVNSPAEPDTWESVYVATVSSERFALRGRPAGVGGAAVRLLRGRRAGLLPGAGAARREAAAAARLPLRVSDYETTRSGDRGRLPRLGAGAAARGRAPRRAGRRDHRLGAGAVPRGGALRHRAGGVHPADRRRRREPGTHGVLTLVLRTTA
jgi:hypothetical protein